MAVGNPREALAAAPLSHLCPGDDDYPPLLRAIHDPPPVLYVRGDASVLRRPQLAIVGARRASAVGQRIATELAGAACRAGLAITSGLAIGIDGAAHRGALAAGGTTVAVLATGVDDVYPRRHTALAAEIVTSGCLVSEFPPGTPPRRANFPQRNRIVTGLSLGTVVVEAALPSGSLISAASALEQGREVFALPWSIAHAGGAGCLKLIREGAKMVLAVEDVLEELGALYPLAKPCSLVEEAGSHALLDLLGCDILSADALVAASGRPAPEVLQALSELELAGQVLRSAAGYQRA